MRGNESGIPQRESFGFALLIPMRGNELPLDRVTFTDNSRVTDPHEG